MEMSGEDPEIKYERIISNIRDSFPLIKEAATAKECFAQKYLEAVITIADSYMTFNASLEVARKFRLKVVDLLLENHIVHSLATIMKSMIDKLLSSRAVKESLHVDHAKMALNTICIFYNYTDTSANFAEVICKNDNVMKTISRMHQELWTDHKAGQLDKNLGYLLFLTIALAYNMAMHNVSTSIEILKQETITSGIRPYLNSRDESFRITALLFFIYIDDEDKSIELSKNSKAIKFLLAHLKLALTRKQRRADGYSAEELMKAFMKFAVVDENKRYLASMGIIDLLKEVLQSGLDKEKIAALHILGQLSFDADTANLIRTDMLDLINKLSNNEENQKVTKNASELKWMLNKNRNIRRRGVLWRNDAGTFEGHKSVSSNFEETTAIHTTTENHTAGDPQSRMECMRSSPTSYSSIPQFEQKQHIMISYKWVNQSKTIKLRDFLVGKGLEVWMDLYSMEQQMYDSIADGVENAWLVLLCVSRKYKDSWICRQEAVYAHDLKKQIIPLKMEEYQPDGWLGLLIANYVWQDFSGDDISAAGERLLKEIRRLAAKIGLYRQLVSLEGDSSVSESETATTLPVGHDRAAMETLDTATLDLWLRGRGLSWLSDREPPLSGKEIAFLAELREEAPEFFYRYLWKQLGVTSLSRMADLVHALKDLS